MTRSHMVVFSLVIKVILPKKILECQKNDDGNVVRIFWVQNRAVDLLSGI